MDQAPPSACASPFLHLPPSSYIAQSPLAFAIRDRFPVSPGHTLVIPFREVETWFDASAEEQADLFALVDVVKQQLDQGVIHPDGTLRVPDGYNVGFNAGRAAGQTVMHLHIHVIPRFTGDMEDPRGGVRHVIPSKGNYLTPPAPSQPAPLTTGGTQDPFARKILPLFNVAEDISIIVAFVRLSGLKRIQNAILEATARGARVRLLTGDYLGITEPSALTALLDLCASSRAPNTLSDTPSDTQNSADDNDQTPTHGITARVIETAASLTTAARAFHPKSWRFEHQNWGLAFVGSSNLSRSALDTGIEWNLGLDRIKEPETFSHLRASFDTLWGDAKPLSKAWIDAYQRRRITPKPLLTASAQALSPALSPVQAPSPPPAPVDVDDDSAQDNDDSLPLPAPHEVQQEALAALYRARDEGRPRALVVLATGLGKTLLAALDYAQMERTLQRRPKLLFIAHRSELLFQAASHYRRLTLTQGHALHIGWCMEDSADLSADAIFGSVAKLSRPNIIALLQKIPFDYVVIDEVHHAAAPSYKRILDALNAGFVLGLTATPERTDELDIFGIFDDFVAYRADIARGIDLQRLVPFAYHGLKDDIDYAQIPWRNKRFDPEMLARATQTEARMQTLWGAWRAHPGVRTLVFCCSIAHATFTKRWLLAQGVRVEAVFSALGSDDRDEALEKLRAGHLDALCAVDLFNEGIDVRAIDRVVMLRPTESNVIFLQQLGRGLRVCEGKQRLTVIDFVGNHRLFLERLRTLLSLTAQSQPTEQLRALLQAEDVNEAPSSGLPPGCSVALAFEAKHLLDKLFCKRVAASDMVTRAYQEMRLIDGERPTAGALQRRGYDPTAVSASSGGWFLFVAGQGDLSDEEVSVVTAHAQWLLDVERADMSKSFKMILLEALIALGGVAQPVALDALAARSWLLLKGAAGGIAEVPSKYRPDGTDAGDARWRKYWRKNPVEAWTSPKKKQAASMRLVGDAIQLAVSIDQAHQHVLEGFLRELVDLKLTQYRRRGAKGTGGEALVCRVIHHSGGDPILKLPDRKHFSVPEGEQDVRLPDGSTWAFRFMKEFCNVARPLAADRNQLPDLLRRWFGPTAGASGTRFEVRFTPSPDGLWVEPVALAQVIPLPFVASGRSLLTAYPDLRAAAGHAQPSAAVQPPEHVVLPWQATEPDCFAVRVAGDSMDGGEAPLRHGDWAVWRLSRGVAASALDGRVVLVESSQRGDDLRYQMKRLTRDQGAWRFTSDNPQGPAFPPDPSMHVIARLERAFSPDALGPAVGATLSQRDLPSAFGLDELPPVTGRVGGHLFLFIKSAGELSDYTTVKAPADLPPLRPAETAFVLAPNGDHGWRYLGVGRSQNPHTPHLTIPEVDFETWRAWGHGRSASRTPSEESLNRARLIFTDIMSIPDAARVITNPSGNRAFVRSLSRQSLSIDGGPRGFQPRPVSLTDLAWVITAATDASSHAAPLDEARVNRFRYLVGTPKSSTRWIDTGWAIGIYQLAQTHSPS